MNQKDFVNLEAQLNNFLKEKGVVLDEPIDAKWMDEQYKLYEWGMNQYNTLFPAEDTVTIEESAQDPTNPPVDAL
jgi:hypothetical protein